MNRRSILSLVRAAYLSLTLSALACMLAPGRAALAQAQPATAPAGEEVAGGDALSGKESGQSVYVRDSAIAVEKFALAQRMERLKEWDKAAAALQELVEKYSDRVVPSKVDQNKVIYQYVSVTRAVQERLAKWPTEGIDAYKARYESVAADLVAKNPDDLSTLYRAYSLYFVTDTARDAAIKLIDRHLESGDFSAAAWLGDRLLDWHPTLAAQRPAVLYRTALAYHLAGDAEQARARLATLQKQDPKGTGTVRGKDVVLADSLAEALKTAPPVAQAVASDSWPMVGGDSSRSRVSPAAGRMGAKIFDVLYQPSPRRLAGDNAAARGAVAQSDATARELGQTLGVMPAVDRGELFFQDNAHIYAVNLDSGLPLPGWASTYADRNGVYTSTHALPLPRNQQMSIALTDTDVLAITGQLDRQAMAQGISPPGDRETRLVCLDRQTGREKWVATARQLPEEASALRGLELGGSPLVAGDSVYVFARGGKPLQFEDCYVICFSLSDGSYRWSCYLASGNATPDMQDGGISLTSDNIAHMACANGRIYALTNLGAVGAVDAYTGTIVWLNLYPRPKPQFIDFRMRMSGAVPARSPKPWQHNPVIVRDGKVFILPADGDHVLVYDAGTGAELKRIAASELDDVNSLLAVTDDEKLVLASDTTIFCVPWSSYAPGGGRFENVSWTKQLKRRDPGDSIRGRSFVTKDWLFVPTSWAIHRISMHNGKLEATYPKDRPWESGEGPGNIVVTQDHVVIAGADRVNVYTDLEIARAKLDAAVAAAPKDAEPRLDYAEVMFVAGQTDVAIQKLDEAIALLGGVNAMRAGAGRDRVFTLALTFAQKLASMDLSESAATRPSETIDALFDRAQSAATTPAQQVNYRVCRARFAQEQGKPADEVRLYQEILSDPAWRAVQIASADDGSTMQAGLVAEQAIDKAINDAGPDIYASYEEKAAAELESARGGGNNPAGLLSIAQTYPNAAAAPRAMLAAADAYESAGKARQATQVLNQAYRKYRDRADRARLIEAQVRNYLALPNGLGVAIGRLAEGAKLPGELRLTRPLKLPGGKTIDAGQSFTAALDTLREQSAQIAARSLPDFHIPIPNRSQPRTAPFLPEDERSIVSGIETMLIPDREHARYDRVVTYSSGKGVSIFAVGSPSPLLTTAAPGEAPKGCAWVGDDSQNLLIWGNSTIALLKGNDAAPQWTVQLASMPELEVVTAGGDVTAAEEGPDAAGNGDVVILENQVIRFGRRGRRGPIQVQAIGGVNVAPPNPAPAGNGEMIETVCPVGDRVVLCTSTGRVLAIEYASGKVAWQTRLSLSSLAQLIASDDFAVARLVNEFGTQLVVLDTFTGEITHRRPFAAGGGGGAAVPVNMTLAPDGMLVYTLQNRICGKDLYDPGKALSFEYPAAGDGGPIYIGANMPGQLVVSDGRALAVSDNGMLVRVHSLENGKEVTKALSTGTSNWAVKLFVVGPSLYVQTQKGVTGYQLDRLDRPSAVWTSMSSTQSTPNIRDSFIGRDFIILLDQLTNRPDDDAEPGPPRYRLWAYGRYPIDGQEGTESGRLDYYPVITHPVGITQWQAVEGGFYYRSADRRMHFLRGARNTGQ